MPCCRVVNCPVATACTSPSTTDQASKASSVVMAFLSCSERERWVDGLGLLKRQPIALMIYLLGVALVPSQAMNQSMSYQRPIAFPNVK